MKKILLVGFGLTLVMAVNAGCVTTRIMDKDGKVVRETTSWEPLVVISPVVYDGPVEYVDGSYYPPTRVVVRERYPVIVERPYYRPVRVRALYLDGRHGHHRR